MPLCAECAALLQRSSGDEERLGKLRRVSAGLAGGGAGLDLFTASAPKYRVLDSPLLALLLGGAAAGWFFTIQTIELPGRLRRRNGRCAGGELEDFTSRSATFVFANETFAEQFKEQNESLLMNG